MKNISNKKNHNQSKQSIAFYCRGAKASLATRILILNRFRITIHKIYPTEYSWVLYDEKLDMCLKIGTTTSRQSAYNEAITVTEDILNTIIHEYKNAIKELHKLKTQSPLLFNHED